MSILKNIVIDIKKELKLKKSIIPISEYEKMSLFKRNTISMTNSIKNDSFGIIAEFKRRSPSKNEINNKLSVDEVCRNYQTFGASGLSVLTNLKYFGGSLEDLVLARSIYSFPILRKDFIIDEYQIYESKAFGADIILLISSILTKNEIINLSKKAKIKYLKMQIGDVKSTRADITKFKKKFGFSFDYDLSKGIQKFVEWYKNFKKN